MHAFSAATAALCRRAYRHALAALLVVCTTPAKAVVATTPGTWSYSIPYNTGTYHSPRFDSVDEACTFWWGSNPFERVSGHTAESPRYGWGTAPGQNWYCRSKPTTGATQDSLQVGQSCIASDGWLNGNNGQAPGLCYKTVASCPSGQTADTNGLCRPNSCPEGQKLVVALNACRPTVTPKPPQTPPPQCSDPAWANPIYPLRGAKREVIDTRLSVGRLSLQFSYDSTPKAPLASGSSSPQSTGQNVLGELWSSNLHRRAVVQNSGQLISAVRGNGHVVAFLRSVPGTYVSSAHLNDRLYDITGGGYLYVDAAAQSQEVYGPAGNLASIRWATGESIQFTYSDTGTPGDVAPGAGFLIVVQDHLGRSLGFRYNAAGRIAQVIDAASQVMELSYGDDDVLSAITWPDGTVRSFLYESAAHPWALTAIQDENSDRYAEFAYDSLGRAIGSQHAGGANAYSVAYGVPPILSGTDTYDAVRNLVISSYEWQAATGISITQPNESVSQLSASIVQGLPHLTGQTQPAGSGCAASSRAQTHDANGNIASRTDFNGNRSCHAHDLTRNLETAKIEGFGGTDTCPADIPGYTVAAGATQRKTVTQWHPDWRLPVKRAEPRRITFHVYNGQPDPTAGNATASCAPATAVLPDAKRIAVLCKTVEQATTDATGSQGFGATLTGTPRTWTYTYNGRGQMLTARDPLARLTTYAYYSATTADHTAGDLQSITNAASQVTQHTHYDKSGRLLRSVDANGTATSTTYTPRGWVSTVAITPLGGTQQVTTYDYDGVGQLKKATLPDGTALEYTYDAAHRLTGVKDAAGNSVTYTLDSMGNRTAEALKDPAGTLMRKITRAYDALNRLERATGGTQ
jgi:YD repeat-containing protein